MHQQVAKLSHRSYDTKYHGGESMAKILVVDDELSIRMGIREFAEYQGYKVEEAANGKKRWNAVGRRILILLSWIL